MGVQHKFRYIYWPRLKGGVWSREVEVHFVNLMALDGLVNACWDAFYVIAFMGGVWSTHVDIHFVPRWHGLVITSWDTFCVLAGMGWVCQHKLIYILCHRWHGRGLVNACWDAICDLTSMVWSTQVEIHFLYSLALEGFGQQNFRYIVCVLAARNAFGGHMLSYI